MRASKFKKIGVNVLVLALIGLLTFLVLAINRTDGKYVEVVQAKQNIYPNQLMTSGMFKKYSMPLKEFKDSGNKYVLFEDIDKLDNKYSTIYIHNGLYVVEGEARDSKPIKNAWIQEMGNSNLVITLPYNKSEAFGNLLTPGDHIRVEVSYKQDEVNTSDMFAGVSTDIITETLFDKIRVSDLLNSSGNSIYDYYTDLLNLPIEDREELLRDENFLSQVSPVSMLLEVDTVGFKKYAKLGRLSGLKYTYGLHKREEGDLVVDQFQDLTRQITNAQTKLQSEGGN